MAMQVPPTHCSRCCQPDPEYVYTHTEWHLAGWMRATIRVPVPLCKTCHLHTVNTRRKKMMILTVLLTTAIIGLYSFPRLNLGGNLLIWAVAFFALIAAFCGIAIWGIPRFLRPDFLDIRYSATTNRASITFTNADYQAKTDHLDNVMAAADKLFAETSKKWGPPKP